jgi:hypothetical protein
MKKRKSKPAPPPFFQDLVARLLAKLLGDAIERFWPWFLASVGLSPHE